MAILHSGQSSHDRILQWGKARIADFNAGDVGYVPITFGHYIENVGDTDLIFIELFKASQFMDLSLSEWIANTPPELVTAHLGLGEVLKAIPKTKSLIMPASIETSPEKICSTNSLTSQRSA